jgi:hypothetical protein
MNLKRTFTGRRRWLLISGGLAVILLAGLISGYHVAIRNPRTCLACHYMDPFYRQWETSNHSQVNCIRCHDLGFFYLAKLVLKYNTGLYNPRPKAIVQDKSCMASDCHPGRIEAGQVTYQDQVAFDHQTHMQDYRTGVYMRCTSCHAQIVQKGHVEMDQRVCFLCHFKDVPQDQALAGCTSCHNFPTGEIEHEGFIFSHDSYLKVGVACRQCHLQISQGEGGVPAERCYSCHVERTERFEDVDFVHKLHVQERKIDCFLCHDEIQHAEIKMISALEVSCTNCHQLQHTGEKEMYMGTGGRDVEDTPSRMFTAQVSCDGCHEQPPQVTDGPHVWIDGGRTRQARRQSCVTCHGPGYDRMLDDWIREIHRMVELFRPELVRVEKAAAKLPQKERTEAGDLLEDARFNLNFVDRGRGVHNVEYGVKLIKRAADIVDQVRTKLNPNYRPPARGELLDTPDGYCTILCHDRLGVPSEVRFERMDFPHEFHHDGIEIECTRCHSPDKHKMRIITRTECMNCHHQPDDIDCAHCHTETAELYTGSLKLEGVEPFPDFPRGGIRRYDGPVDQRP